MEKKRIEELIRPFEIALSLNSSGKKKKKELFHLTKFIAASSLKINILDANIEAPDFIIDWAGNKYGLEHVELINHEKKDLFERTEKLIKSAESKFLSKYGHIGKQVDISLQFEIPKTTLTENKKLLKELKRQFAVDDDQANHLFRLAYPNRIANEEFETAAEEIADSVFLTYTNSSYQQDRFITRISFLPSRKTHFTRSVGYVSGSIDGLLLKTLRENETKIENYKINTDGIQQCLLLVTHGCNGFSDYSHFDPEILVKNDTKFDKVIAFNLFTEDFFILK